MRKRMSYRRMAETPFVEKIEEVRRQRREEKAKMQEIRYQVKILRQSQVGQGLEEKFFLPYTILRERSMKGVQYAQKLGVRWEFVDYEMMMASRPGKCPDCQQPMVDEHDLTVAHIVPLSRQGAHTYKNMEVVHTDCYRRAKGRLAAHRAQMKRAEINEIRKAKGLRTADWGDAGPPVIPPPRRDVTPAELTEAAKEAKKAELFAKWDKMNAEAKKDSSI